MQRIIRGWESLCGCNVVMGESFNYVYISLGRSALM